MYGNVKELAYAKQLSKDNKVGRLILCNFKAFYKAVVIKIVWYWQRYRWIQQGNKTDTYSLISFAITAKEISGEREIFSTNDVLMPFPKLTSIHT